MTTQVTEEVDSDSVSEVRPARPNKLRQKLRAQEPAFTNPLREPVEQPVSWTRPEVEETEIEPRAPASSVTKVAKQLREDEDKSIVDWLKSIENEAPIRISVSRKEPKEFHDPATGIRKKVDGLLRSYDRPISEEEIQRNHGGGTFTIRIHRRDGRGSYVFFTSRTVEIAGDPALDDVPRSAVAPTRDAPAAPPAPSDNPLMAKLVDNLIKDKNSGPDITATVNAALAPIMASNKRLEELLDRKDRELAEMRKGDPHEVTFQQKLLDKFVDQDSARLQAVRAQYESEIRQLKEGRDQDEKRIRDIVERDKDYMRQAFEREMSTLKHSYDVKISAIEQSFLLQKTMLENDNKRLERERDELRVEVRELRNKKEPSLRDKVDEIKSFKDLVGDIGGSDDDEKPSTITKVIEGLAGSEMVAGFAQRILSGGGGQAVPEPQLVQQPMQLPVAPPRRRGPRLVRDRRNGQVYATDGQHAIPVQRKRPIAPAPEAVQAAAPQVDENGQPVEVPAEAVAVAVQQEPEPVEVPIPYIAPEQVAIAVDYMTKAYQNNVEPGTFVDSVRAFLPADMVSVIAAMGVDQFLVKVGGLTASSPLMGQGGRNWSRKVARYLLGE